jgi:hypothetical protein
MTARPFTFTVTAPTPVNWYSTTVNQWVQLSGTTLTSVMTDAEPFSLPKRYISSYSGGSLDPTNSDLYVIGGGHADNANNGVYRLRLNQSAPSWTKLRGPTQPVSGSMWASGEISSTSTVGYAYYHDGRPCSRHTYNQVHAQPTLNKVFLHGGQAIWGNGNGSTNATDAFNVATGDYDATGTHPSAMSYGQALIGVRDSNGDVWFQNNGNGQVTKWTLATQAYSFVGSGSVYEQETPACYDSTRNRIVRLPARNSQGAYWNRTGAFSETRFSFSSGLTNAFNGGYAVYDPINDRYLLLPIESSVIWSVHPTTWAATVLATTGTPWTAGNAGINRYYGRFAYVPQFGGVIVQPSADVNCYWMKTS